MCRVSHSRTDVRIIVESMQSERVLHVILFSDSLRSGSNAVLNYGARGPVEPGGGKETKALENASEVNLIAMSIALALGDEDFVAATS